MPNSRSTAGKRFGHAAWRLVCRIARETEAAQILELAVTLPLLVVIFVGIYDFGQAFNLKQKLTAAAREGARFASNESTSDLTAAGTICGTAPNSICAVRDVVDAYLVANNVNDCGLTTNGTTVSQVGAPAWTWQFTTSSTSGCPGTFTLTINRGYAVPVAGSTATGGNIVTAEATQVSLSYPYQWHFNSVIQFLVPNTTYAAVSQIPTNATMQNLN